MRSSSRTINTRRTSDTAITRRSYSKNSRDLAGTIRVIDRVCKMFRQFRLECNCSVDLEMMPILVWIPRLVAISLLKRNAAIGISHLQLSRRAKFIRWFRKRKRKESLAELQLLLLLMLSPSNFLSSLFVCYRVNAPLFPSLLSTGINYALSHDFIRFRRLVRMW